VVINTPGRLLEKALGLPGFEFTGAVNGVLQNVSVQYPTRIQASGEITWTDAGIALPFGLRLGTFVLTLEPTETGARGTISDRGGDLALNGDVEWIGSRYTANIRLQARGGPPELARALNYVGAMNPDGSRQLLIEGDLL
jgi:Type II secretion system (T2SS), protein N